MRGAIVAVCSTATERKHPAGNYCESVGLLIGVPSGE